MNLLNKVFGNVIGKVVDAADDWFTSDEERDQKKNELTAILLQGEKDAQDAIAQMERELTKRMELDMKSDSWLSKNVRPGSLVFLLGVVTVLAVTDGNISFDWTTTELGVEVVKNYTFSIKNEYIELFKALLITAFTFYFGSRGFEKVAKLKSKG